VRVILPIDGTDGRLDSAFANSCANSDARSLALYLTLWVEKRAISHSV